MTKFKLLLKPQADGGSRKVFLKEHRNNDRNDDQYVLSMLVAFAVSTALQPTRSHDQNRNFSDSF